MSSMVVMIVLGLLVIFSFVVAYFSARTWSITHVVLVVLLFLTSIAFVILASASLKTKSVWQAQFVDLKEQLDAEINETNRMLYGDTTMVQQDDKTLPGLKGDLERELLDRGRVWRGARPEEIRQGEIVVNMQAFGDAKCLREGQDEGGDLEPQEDPEAQAPARQHGITEDMTLFIFQEAGLADLGQGPRGEARLAALLPDRELLPVDEQGVCRLPVYYLGVFRVTTVAGDIVSLAPTQPLDAAQIERIQAGGGSTWTLYDIMPIDRHDIFAGLDAEQLQAVFDQETMGLNNEQYGALIEEFVRDSKEAREADPEERTWRPVKFVQEYKIKVDAEAAGEDEMADRDFDPSGYAVSPLLRQQNRDPDAGPEVSFSPGDVALFDADSARRLLELDPKVCEADEGITVYRRRLRDFESLFHRTALRAVELTGQQLAVQRQTKAIDSAVQEAKRQIQYRNVEKGKLGQDLDGWKREVQGLTQLSTALTAQSDQKRTKLSYLYRKNNQLLAKLTDLQSQLVNVLSGQ